MTACKPDGYMGGQEEIKCYCELYKSVKSVKASSLIVQKIAAGRKDFLAAIYDVIYFSETLHGISQKNFSVWKYNGLSRFDIFDR